MSEKFPVWVQRLKPMATGLGLVLLLQVLAGAKYGLFRDELYYLSCSHTLAWGYVDHPPLSVWLLRAWIGLFGDAGTSVRALSLTVSLLSVVAVGALAWELYGEAKVVAITCVAAASMPVLRVVGTLYSPNTLEMGLWALSILVWVRCMRRPAGSLRAWAGLGVVLGLTVLNRLSGLWLCGALVVSTVVWLFKTPDWRPRVKGIWLAPLLTLLIMLPWVVWQRSNGWPTLEFVRNANAHKLLPVPAWQFVATQIVVTNPFVAVLWIWALFRGWGKRVDRSLLAGFCCVALILILNGRSRENYLAPAYAFILPVGASLLRERAKGFVAVMALSGLVFGFICLPILPAPMLARILAMFPAPPSAEKGAKSVLQGLSDTMGWPEMAQAVAGAWTNFPVPIMTNNYGEAAALEYYGPRYGLPVPLCAHNEYWLRGYGAWDGSSVLFVGSPPPELTSAFASCRLVGRVDAPWAVPEEAHAGIWLLTGGHVPPAVLWPRLKKFE